MTGSFIAIITVEPDMQVCAHGSGGCFQDCSQCNHGACRMKPARIPNVTYGGPQVHLRKSSMCSPGYNPPASDWSGTM